MYFAVAAAVLVTVIVKKTVAGRRFEAVGRTRIAAWAAGLRAKRHGMSAYVWAMVMYWLAGVLIAGIVAQPTAYQGDAYLLSSVAAVVLGGTSLLGGQGLSDLHRAFGLVPDPTRPIRPRRSASQRRSGRWSRPAPSPSALRSTPSTGRRYEHGSPGRRARSPLRRDDTGPG